MSENTDPPVLVQMGAGTDDDVRDVNLDVSGTVGPDHLGQETTTVNGHPKDRPGVQSRLPETTSEDDPRVRRMDTGEDLPVLLSSDMSADPIEGVQGSYTQIVEGECVRCGYDRLRVTVNTLPGVHKEACNACGAEQTRGGYRMPKTDKDRVRDEKNAGRLLGSLTTRGVYDLEPDTGTGPYVSLVGSNGFTRLRKDDADALFWLLEENGDIGLVDSIKSNTRPLDQVCIAVALLPDDLTVTERESIEE